MNNDKFICSDSKELDRILHDYAINRKIYDLTDIIEFLKQSAKELRLPTIICISQLNETLLASACFTIVNNEVVKFNERELIRNWKNIKSSIAVRKKIRSYWVKKYISINKQTSRYFNISRIRLKEENSDLHLGYLIYEDIHINQVKLKNVLNILSYLLKFNIQTYAQEQTIKREKVNKLKEKYPIEIDSKNSSVSSIHHSAFEQVLQVSLEFTNSQAGSIYMYNQSTDELLLEYYIGDSPPPNKFNFKKNKKSVIAHCFCINKYFVANNVSLLSKIYDEVEYFPAFSTSIPLERIAEVALPIWYATRTTSEIVGVLNLEKIDGTFTRNHIETLQYEIIGKFLFINELISQSNSIYNLLEIISKNISSYNYYEPNQFIRMREVIHSALKHCIENTPAYSATFRYHDALTDRLTKLFSIGRHYDKGKDLDHIYVKNFGTYVGANTFYYGEERYIKNIHKYRNKQFPKIYPDLRCPAIVRKDLKSELCIPLYQGMRVIGTINFESNVVNAFDSHLDYLRGMVKLIEFSLNLDISMIEHRAFKEKTRVYYDLHELLGTIPFIKNKIDHTYQNKFSTSTPTSTETLNKELDHLFQTVSKLSDYYKIKKTKKFKGHQSLKSILDKAIKKHGYARHTSLTIDNDYLLSPDISNNIFLASDNIISNVKKYSNYSELSIYINKLLYRHRTSVRISFGSKTHFMINESDIEKLYKIPIMKGNKVCLGAFVAGCLIREISGNIYIGDDYKDEKFLKTIIEIPILKEI